MAAYGVLCGIAIISYLSPILFRSREDALTCLVVIAGLLVGIQCISVLHKSSPVAVWLFPALGCLSALAVVPSSIAREFCSNCTSFDKIHYAIPLVYVFWIAVNILTICILGQSTILLRWCTAAMLLFQQVLLFQQPKLCPFCVFMGLGLIGILTELPRPTLTGQATLKVAAGLIALGMVERYCFPWKQTLLPNESLV